MATFNFGDAAHLLRRMGFGGTPADIDNLLSRGKNGAVDYLLNYSAIDNSEMDGLLASSFDFSNPFDNTRFNENELRRWWFTRMAYTNRGFEEKMVLFWHNHFATSLNKVPEQLMYSQYQIFRNFGLDQLDNLLLKVSQDAAMLVWLDGITNVRGKPNENFGRELQELFTMGINDVVTGTPNYTENDVKEVARAFTGWKFRRDRTNPDPFFNQFIVNPSEHDSTAKTIYGQTAAFNGEDVITIISARRATPRFLVKKIFEFFVYPLQSNTADNATIEKFADVYMNNNHSMREVFRAIFISDEFFSQRARFALVKNPVEVVVGAIRMLNGRYIPGTIGQQTSNTLYLQARTMGLDLFAPPDVSGWKLNLGWVNTATSLARFNFANTLITSRPVNPSSPGMQVPSDQLKKSTHKKKAPKTVANFLSLLGPLGVDAATTQNLTIYLQTNDQGGLVKYVGDDATVDLKVRGLVHQIMSLPEFQLN